MRTPCASFGGASTILAFFSSAACLLGCPPEAAPADETPELPVEASRCPTDFPEDYPETRTVELGYGTGADFEPWPDGFAAKLYHGSQGLEMTTPSLRVPAKDGEPDEACLRVRLVNDYHGQISSDDTFVDALQTSVRFVRTGSFYVTDGHLYNALSFSRDQLVDIDITITARVQGPGFEATHSQTQLFQ